MTTLVSSASPRQMPVLLRGEVAPVRSWVAESNPARLVFHVAVILAGAGIYGAAIGLWRSGEQALFTAVKFPLILLLTTTLRPIIGTAGTLLPTEKKFFLQHWGDSMRAADTERPQ